MGLLAVGSGHMFAYLPIKLGQDGVEPWVAGSLITAMAVGSFAGCLISGGLVRRVGHARIFACMAAVVSLSYLLICFSSNAYIWIISRGLYGVATTGLFIVSQSWLNDACENEWRGKVIGAFYTTYVLSIGFGSFLVKFVDLSTLNGPLISLSFTALAVLPIGLTRLKAPEPPEAVNIAIRSVWKISPVGLTGLLAVGGLTMLVQGFAPIYATAEGYSKSDIASLMFFMQFGMLAVQMPLGAISDRTDRRFVLVLACIIIVVSASVALQTSALALLWLVVMFGIWGGATETIFSVASAHANDRAEPQYYVSLSSTLLVAWSISGIVLPAVATALTPTLGPKAFMYVVIATAAFYAAFVCYRLLKSDPVPEDDQEPYQQVSAQIPLTTEFGPLPPEEEDESGT